MRETKRFTAKASVRASKVDLYVEGLEFTCPLCRAVVGSGEFHHCVNGKPVVEDKKAVVLK
jgi:hypothetical protein